MSLFEQLRDQFTQYDEALTVQTHLLTKAAGDFASAFGAYVGLPAKNWTHAGGAPGDKYIRLVKGTIENHEEIAWHRLSSVGGVVHFMLAFTIDAPATQISRYTFVFEIDLQFNEEGYLFRVKHVGDFVISAEDVKAGRFDPAYDGILGKISSNIDPSKVLIRT